jgi:Tol biopolymer transport system component
MCAKPAVRFRPALTALLTLLAVAAGGGSAHATYPGTSDGRIAFGRELATGQQPDVYSILPNGEALRQLTNDPAADICPAYSADGKQIAFCSSRSGASEIWKMKHNGTRAQQITRLGTAATFPDFSPDASKISFTSQGFFLPSPTSADVFVVDSEGSGTPMRLTNSVAFDGFPAYSPDGQKIAFISGRTGINQVWVMNADGSNPVQLTFDPLPKGQVPDWSPDGRRLAYQAATAGNGDIWVMNADGSAQTRLTTDPAFEYGPAWSPTGGRIAFVRPRGHTVLTAANLADRDIWVMNADGSDAYVLHHGSGVPAWQPLGKRLRSPSANASQIAKASPLSDGGRKGGASGLL